MFLDIFPSFFIHHLPSSSRDLSINLFIYPYLFSLYLSPAIVPLFRYLLNLNRLFLVPFDSGGCGKIQRDEKQVSEWMSECVQNWMSRSRLNSFYIKGQLYSKLPLYHYNWGFLYLSVTSAVLTINLLPRRSLALSSSLGVAVSSGLKWDRFSLCLMACR